MNQKNRSKSRNKNKEKDKNQLKNKRERRNLPRRERVAPQVLIDQILFIWIFKMN